MTQSTEIPPQSMTSEQPPMTETTHQKDRWGRMVVAVVVHVYWFGVTMRDATANTSWEHHPYGGPFILLKESRAGIDLAVSLFVLVSILAPTAAWVWTGKLWAAITAVIVVSISIWMSIFLAANASC